MNHPVDKSIDKMRDRDRKIAEELREAGWDDEDLYAALPTPNTDKLLRKEKRNDY